MQSQIIIHIKTKIIFLPPYILFQLKLNLNPSKQHIKINAIIQTTSLQFLQQNIRAIIRYTTDQQFMSHVKQCQKSNKKPTQNKQQFIYQKLNLDETMTTFRWQKIKKLYPPTSINNLAKQKIKKLSFQQKQYWFRNKLQKLRISWTLGADWIKLQKNNILMSSLNQIKKIDMHKEVKVQFIGQKVNDAGGLLREWTHMVIKEIFDYNTGIFIFANTDDTMYSLKWDQQLDQYFSAQLLNLLGVVIGKAIFQRIPVNCFLDRSILRQLTNSCVVLQDIYGFDKQLYKNWKHVLETQIHQQDQLQTYFVTYKNNGGNIQQIELLEGHKDIKVTNQNKQLYITLSIQTHTMLHIQKSLTQIKKGINTVFPIQYLQIFQPYQLEMILYGVPYIDLQDWHDNTLYKAPYSQTHHVIKWFWTVMEDFDQEQLGRILHFCTASTRTPIHGFSKLEGNRGTYAKFLIQPSEYNKKNPYPKGHTCFNRLDLPQYPDFETLKTYLTAISKHQLDGVFGLD